MPSSNLAVAPTLIHLVWECHPRRILDVGPGRGKYGLLLREYIAEDLIVDAVEAWEPYVTDRLRAVYDRVIVADVLDLEPAVLAGYDLFFLADVLEHIDKPAGFELLARLPGWVIISTPRDFFQNPEADEIPTERHRSHWTPADFTDPASPLAPRFDYLDHKLLADIGGLIVRLRPSPPAPPPAP